MNSRVQQPKMFRPATSYAILRLPRPPTPNQFPADFLLNSPSVSASTIAQQPEQNDDNFIPLDDSNLPEDYKLSGRCHFTLYDKDTTPLRNVTQFEFVYEVERAPEGFQITFSKDGGKPMFRHWLDYPVDYSPSALSHPHARYLANNTLEGMSKEQVTIDVMFPDKKEGAEFAHAYNIGRVLDGNV